MSEVVIELVGVRRVFEEGRIVALNGVDLTIEAGTFVTITGPSGSGKTTLLNLMGAMDLPDEGQVRIDGVTLDEKADLDRLRSEKIGFVFQMHNLIPVLSAVENVEIPMITPTISRGAKRARALELLDRVGLGDRSHSNVRGLSGGERQRVALARALANEPKMLLADEPTGNLDSATGEEVIRLLHELRERTGAALVLVTHNEDLCAGVDRWVKMRDGEIDND